MFLIHISKQYKFKEKALICGILFLKMMQVNLFVEQRQTYGYWGQTCGYEEGNVGGGEG